MSATRRTPDTGVMLHPPGTMVAPMSRTPEVAPPAPAAAPVLTDPSLYLNRELSWLEFNRRVLAQAQDTTHPLLERVKFLAISAYKESLYAERALRAGALGYLSKQENYYFLKN